MGIEDIQISEELETNAPSIKYRGNEGPKSPQEMQEMMMASAPDPMDERNSMMETIAMEEFGKPLSDLNEDEIIQIELFMEEMSGGQPLPQDPTKPVNPFQPKPTGPVLPDRQMAAYGGIMGMDGRRQYGLGSSLKKFARKIIPNEIADIAVKAAPFVAPFNPIAAGLMSGIGSFDQTGKIGSSLKSGLMNYGMGQGARYLGGADFQKGINPLGGFTPGTAGTGTFSKYFSKPTGSGGIKNLFDKPTQQFTFDSSGIKTGDTTLAETLASAGGDLDAQAAVTDTILNVGKTTKTPSGLLKTIKDFALDNKLLTGLAAGTLGAAALMGNMEPDEIQDMQRGEGLDIDGIRAEVQEAMADETGELLKALRVKYPFLGRRDTKDYAMGGRAGFAEGGGIMDLGGMEKDYRAEGGFVPIGREEKADDVPARLSVNEFVFTADAVRNAGGGDIDKGAEVMENMMKNLEAGGQVSEESQGMAGAQQMFETSQRLSEVI